MPPRRDDALRNGEVVPNCGAQRKAQGNHLLPSGNLRHAARRRRLKSDVSVAQLRYRQIRVSVPSQRSPLLPLTVQRHTHDTGIRPHGRW